jgi:hypothetical protein
VKAVPRALQELERLEIRIDDPILSDARLRIEAQLVAEIASRGRGERIATTRSGAPSTRRSRMPARSLLT